MDEKSTGGLRPPWFLPLVAGLLFFGGGLVGNHFVDPQTNAAYVWPATGVTIGVLSLVPVARWAAYLIAIAIASTAVSLLHGETIDLALGFTLIELVSSGTVAWALQRSMGRPPRLDSLRAIGTFVAIAVLGGSLLSSIPGAALLTLARGAPFAPAWGMWLIANAVGTLLVSPAIVAWSDFRPKRSGGLAKRDFRIGLVFFVLLLLTLFAVFGNRVIEIFPEYIRLALTYLPEPFVVLTALAWGVRGGSVSLLALAAIALHSMSRGDGHFISQASGLEESIYELQLYLAITALMALLIAAMLAEQERALRASDAWRVRYEAAATAAGQVVFDVDPASGAVVWGDNVEAVLGQPAAKLSSIDAVTTHVEGAARARLRLMFDALRASESEAHAATIVWPGGRGATQVEFVARAISDFDGTIYRIAGMARVIAGA
ncbi:MAG: MASE1 domain-containing protein [Betaproteobacteria bacterium]